MKTNRRTFLKFLGIASVAPKIAVDVFANIKSPKKIKWREVPLDYINKKGITTGFINSDSRKYMAKYLYKRSIQPSYFPKWIGRNKNSIIVIRNDI